MAELRCPMCSKMNPDTLDVCQFCGARLKPLILSQTGAPDLPADRNKPAPPPPPSVEPPKRDAGDWLSSLRTGSSSLDSSSESAPQESAEPTSSVDDWLAKLRAQDEVEDEAAAPQPAAEEPGSGGDWLARLRAQDEVQEAEAPAPQPAADETGSGEDWLSSLRAPSQETPSWLSEAAPGESGQPDWLSSGAAAPEPGAQAELPPWLASESEPATPQEGASTIDRLRALGGEADATMVSRPEAAGEGELPSRPAPELAPGAPAENAALPDWLSSIEASPDETVAITPPAAGGPAEIPPWLVSASGQEEPTVPEWLASAGGESDETIAAPPPAPASKPAPAEAGPPMPSWLESPVIKKATGPLSDDTTVAWSPGQTPGGPGAQPPSKKAVVGTTEWLGEEESPLAPGKELPEWLKDSASAPPSKPGQKAVIGTTDWLASEESTPAPESGERKLGTTGWLSSLSASVPTEEPEWLKDVEPAAQSPAAAPPSAPGEKSVIGTTDWLASEESTPAPESGERKLGTTGWLSSLSASVPTEEPEWLKDVEPPAQPPAATPPSAPGEKSVVGTTDWLASEESTPAHESGEHKLGTTGWLSSLSASVPTEEPEWLKDVEPPAQPPAAAPPSAPGEKSVVGTTDWLASEESKLAPETGERKLGTTGWLSSLSASTPTGELDWLKEVKDSAGPPSAPSESKAVVGSTDWFASPESAPAPETPPVDLPDWLTAPTPPPAETPGAPGEKSVVGTTDWLASEESRPAPESSERKLGTTGWLSSLSTSTPTGELDWLKEVKDSAGPPSAPSESKAVVGSTDWFASPESAPAPETPPVDLPDWLTAPTPPPVETPGAPGEKSVVGTTDWLTSEEPKPAPESSERKLGTTGWLSSLTTPAPKDEMDWLKGVESPTAPPGAPDQGTGIGTTDWLKTLGIDQPAGTSPATSQPGGKVKTGWLSASPAEAGAAPPGKKIGGTDWLDSLTPAAAPPAQTRPKTKPFDLGGPAVPASETELPDWAKSASTPAGSPSGPAVVGTSDWFKSGGPEKGGAADTSGARKTDLSDLDWLSALEPSRTAPPASPAVTTGPLAPASGAGTEPSDLPPWLAALKPSGFEISTPPPQPTATPAAITEEVPRWAEPTAPRRPGSEETTASAAALVAPTAAAAPAIARGAPAGAGDLEAANMPAWLRALRPVEASAVVREPEMDRQETTGPLAGMRGVLPAESVISIAGIPGATVLAFELTDMHNRLAERLRRLIREEAVEDVEIKPRKQTRFNFDFIRVAVAFVMLTITLIPYVAGPLWPADLFPPPIVPAAGNPLANRIEALPADQPVLVAVEYEPAFTGELNVGVESVIVHLLRHGVRVVTVSSSPAGAGIAQSLLVSAADEVGDKVPGRHFLNLGYIPGGPAGLQQFATAPLATIRTDFNGNADPFANLPGFNSISNFQMVIVASASADGLQNWLQQVKPHMAENQPMAAITSAAAAPLAAPYTRGANPQLTAIVSGLAGAIEYDQASRRAPEVAALTSIRWASLGFGLYTIAAILSAGALFSTLIVITTRKPKKARATAKATTARTRPRPATRTKRARTTQPSPGVQPMHPAHLPAEGLGLQAPFEEEQVSYAPASEPVVEPVMAAASTMNEEAVLAQPFGEPALEPSAPSPSVRKVKEKTKGKTTKKGSGKGKAPAPARTAKPKLRKV